MKQKQRAITMAAIDEAVRQMNQGIQVLHSAFQESAEMAEEWNATTGTISRICDQVENGKVPVSTGLSALSVMIGEMAENARACELKTGEACGHGRALLFSFTFPRAVAVIAAYFGCSLARGKELPH
jgi:hypothetical protein